MYHLAAPWWRKSRIFTSPLTLKLRIEGRSDDLILLQLIEAHCIPILTYGIEMIRVRSRDEPRSLRVAYNAVFRKGFGYRQYKSESQAGLNRLSVGMGNEGLFWPK